MSVWYVWHTPLHLSLQTLQLTLQMKHNGWNTHIVDRTQTVNNWTGVILAETHLDVFVAVLYSLKVEV